MQIFNKFSQSFIQVGVQGEVLVLIHVVYIIPLDVYGDSSFLGLIKNLLGPLEGLVAELALVITQGPVGWKEWFANDFSVLFNNRIGSGSNENVKVQDAS